MNLAPVLLVGGAALAAFLLLRSRQAPPTASHKGDPRPPYGLTLEGPTTAHLPAEGDTLGPPYPAVLIAHVSLPAALWPAAGERLTLVVTGPDGWQRENTFSALDQPLNVSIDPHFEPPVPIARITHELLAKHTGRGDDVLSTFRANLVLLDLPPGRGTYHARAVLDDLRSNERNIDVSVDAAPARAR